MKSEVETLDAEFTPILFKDASISRIQTRTPARASAQPTLALSLVGTCGIYDIQNNWTEAQWEKVRLLCGYNLQ